MNLRTLLHPTDFSTNAASATDATRSLARLVGARVCLLHKVVFPRPKTPVELLDQLGDADAFERVVRDAFVAPVDQAREQLDVLASDFRSDGIEVDAHLIESGEAFEAVAEKIGELQPDLVLMGTHGRSGLDRLLMGSVAEKTIRHSECPVLVVPTGATIPTDGNLGHALVAVDFSEASRAALRVGKSLAHAPGLSLSVLHVLDRPQGPFLTSKFDPRELAGQRKAAVRLIRSELGNARAQVEIVEGVPSEEILRQATNISAQWLILGTRGLSGVERLLTGSVTERVTRLSPLPVMTVPSPPVPAQSPEGAWLLSQLQTG